MILSGYISQAPIDREQLAAGLDRIRSLPEQIGTVNRLAADAGYFSKENVERAEKQHISPFIAVKRDKHNQNWQERIAETAPAPDHPTPVEAMRWKLQTPEGKAFYARRKYTV